MDFRDGSPSVVRPTACTRASVETLAGTLARKGPVPWLSTGGSQILVLPEEPHRNRPSSEISPDTRPAPSQTSVFGQPPGFRRRVVFHARRDRDTERPQTIEGRAPIIVFGWTTNRELWIFTQRCGVMIYLSPRLRRILRVMRGWQAALLDLTDNRRDVVDLRRAVGKRAGSQVKPPHKLGRGTLPPGSEEIQCAIGTK